MPDNEGKGCLKVIIVAAIILIMLTSAAVFFYNFNGKSLDFSDRQILVIPTGSMDGESQPYSISTIPEDSIIMVHSLSDGQKSELTVGDVITFHQDGIYKVHRIIEIKDNGTIITKGDANQSPDAAIGLSDVDGKVVGVAPNVGKAVSFVRDLSSGSPLLIIIGVALIIIMICSIIEVIGIIRSRDREE